MRNEKLQENIGLAKKSMWVFPYGLTEKSEWTFWSTQYLKCVREVTMESQIKCKQWNIFSSIRWIKCEGMLIAWAGKMMAKGQSYAMFLWAGMTTILHWMTLAISNGIPNWKPLQLAIPLWECMLRKPALASKAR